MLLTACALVAFWLTSSLALLVFLNTDGEPRCDDEQSLG